MNAIDFFIIVLAVIFIGLQKTRSFVYFLCATTGAFVGYSLGTMLAAQFLKAVEGDLKRGVFALLLMCGLAVLGVIAGMQLGNRLKMRLTQSRYHRFDTVLSVPYKILAVFVAIVLLAQTLIYIPILSLQFMAQGSTLLMPADRFAPNWPLQASARHISADQLSRLTLEYDPNPLTYNNIKDAGDLQTMIDRVAPSVVKISGRNCAGLGLGSGFVVGRGLVMTNAHVIRGASTVYISDHTKVYPATPMAIDYDHDLAVLYSKFLTTKPLPFAKGPTEIGGAAISLGYPAGGDLRLNQGTILGYASQLPAIKSKTTKLTGKDMLLSDAHNEPGNSGGPIFNGQGEIIAVSAAMAKYQNKNVSIFIDAPLAQKLAEKAKNRYIPSKTVTCEIQKKYY